MSLKSGLTRGVPLQGAHPIVGSWGGALKDRAGTDRFQTGAEVAYATPALVEYGTIQEWTKGSTGNGSALINISLVL